VGLERGIEMKPKNGAERDRARKEMEELFGFVPEFYDALPEHARASGWSLQRDLELAETALDNKTKELIGLAVASHIKCKYCIYFHTTAARAFGASEAELREAAAVGGLTALYSNTITGAQVDFEGFRREVDRAIEYVVSKQAEQPRA
jgi:AhpD family alkylhydroperoxidase